MVMSKRNKQTSFADNWLLGRIPEDDFHHQLRIWAKDNIDEDDFEHLIYLTLVQLVNLLILLLSLNFFIHIRSNSGIHLQDYRIKYN